MGIPAIRNRLFEKYHETGDHELLELANGLFRRPARTKGENVSTPMTDCIRNSIRASHATNPHLPLNRIAASFDVNPGRVSETLHGFCP